MANAQNKKTDSVKKKKPEQKKAGVKKTARNGAEENKKKEISESARRQKAAVITAAAAIFLLCVALIRGESAWLKLREVMFGLFGFGACVLPVVLLCTAIVYAKEKPLGGLAANLVGAGAFIALLVGAAHIFSHAPEYFSETGLALQLRDAWKGIPSFSRGGALGALVGGAAAKLFGKTGAGATIIILLAALVMLLTGTTLAGLFGVLKTPVKKISELTNRRMERNAARRERLEREKAETEKIFRPPAGPSEAGGTSAKDFTADEAELINPQDAPEPSIPIIRLPEAPKEDAVEKAVKEAVGEAKMKTAPSPPDGEPAHEKREFPEEEEPRKTEKNGVPEKPEYVFPPIDCLDLMEKESLTDGIAETQLGAKKLIATLESFKIRSEITNICRGPTVTRYELVPEAGVRINKITNLADDIALRLAATSVRIEAPIPGKSAIGVEIPNGAKSLVTMREIVDTPRFREAKSKLNVALGKDITGNIICADLSKMPHLLVAGTTGSGKSVCLNSMIISVLYNASPDEVKLVMIDPKKVEFTVYNGIAHLEVPVVSNPRNAAGALGWAVGEMERRYKLFSETGVRDIKGFNRLCQAREDLKKMRRIVIFIDELSDLMMTAPKEVEDSICRLAQMARAAGIHLVIATQRPSVDVITGMIKANIPSRIALSVSSQVDSRTIIDAAGAEKLLGDGDMLFCPVGSSKAIRVQGCFISDAEVERVVRHVKNQARSDYNEETIREIEIKAAATEGLRKKDFDADSAEEFDPILDDAAEIVVNAGAASATMLQKKLKLGYARASRVMDQLEEKGIIGPLDGSKPRAVLISRREWYESRALADGAGIPNVEEIFSGGDFAASDDEEDFE